MAEHRREFIEFALKQEALSFGSFTTKAGRQSPYFFNAGRFDGGASLATLGRFYARALVAAERERGLAFDMLFGPAYKGITLAAATAIGFAELRQDEGGRDIGFAYNRKEAKTHGEGGLLVGSKLAGRVIIVDDVLTDGASKRESVDMIRAAGAEPVGVVIALDRMERKDEHDRSTGSAVQTFESEYGIPVLAIATLDDIMDWLKQQNSTALASHRDAVAAYRARYGVTGDAPHEACHRRSWCWPRARSSPRWRARTTRARSTRAATATAAPSRRTGPFPNAPIARCASSARAASSSARSPRRSRPNSSSRRMPRIASARSPTKPRAKSAGATPRCSRPIPTRTRSSRRGAAAWPTARRASSSPRPGCSNSARRRTRSRWKWKVQKSKTVPPLLRRRVDDNHAAILDEESAQKALRSEIDRVNARYDEELRRYRELSSGSKAAAVVGAPTRATVGTTTSFPRRREPSVVRCDRNATGPPAFAGATELERPRRRRGPTPCSGEIAGAG